LLKLPDLGDYAVTPVCTSRIPDLGENFVAYGFPHDNPFQPVPGTLGTNNGPGGRYAAASDFDEGMSGGPIYNGKGAVEGLVKGGLDTAAVRWITPIQFAAPLLAIARVSESCDPSTPPWSLDNCRADRKLRNANLQLIRLTLFGLTNSYSAEIR
jgi:hypothetical protein